MTTRPLPNGPLFSCSSSGCAEEYSWPPEDLFWVDAHRGTDPWLEWKAGWYCSICIDGMGVGDDLPTVGGSLAEELASR